MGLLEGLSLTSLVSIVTMLGPLGLVLIMWHGGQLRHEKEARERQKERVELMTRYEKDMAALMTRYEKDMAAVVRMYDDNVVLVKGYERLSGDLANVIHLNTQVQTRLVEKISNNMYCPANRPKER